MAHLKLFFPGLSTSNGLIHLLYGHSALSSLALNSQEQPCDLHPEPSNKKYEGQGRVGVQWRRYRLYPSARLRIGREKVENLTSVRDADSNDYWSQDKNEGFVHALQLEEEEYRLEDVETVRSERWSNASRKLSFSSQTESVQCMESVIVPIQ